MPVRVQLVAEKWNPISAAIRYETRSWPSHAEFINLDTQMTLGARSRGGVRERPSCIDHYTRIEQFTAEGIEAAYEWAKTQIGKKYDYSAITGIVFDRNWHDESRWFCSELVAVAFEKAGHPLLSTRPSMQTWRVTPRDLLLSRSLEYIGS